MKVLIALLVCCLPAFGQVTINVYNNSPPARSAYTAPPPVMYGNGCTGSGMYRSNGCTGGGVSSVAIYSGGGCTGGGRMMSTGCTGGGRMMMSSGCTGGQGGVTYYGSAYSQSMINYSPAPAPSYFGVYASPPPTASFYAVPVRPDGPAMYISGQAPYGARIGGQWATPSGDPAAPGWFAVPGARFPLDGPIRRGFRVMLGYDSGRG
jgi:hypothetical protein